MAVSSTKASTITWSLARVSAAASRPCAWQRKGYRVLVIEKGKRFRDKDFATTNWKVWKYLWVPIARCFGILQMGFFRNVVVLHGAGVGGGSLGYAMVLEQPGDELYEAPALARPGRLEVHDGPALRDGQAHARHG